MLDRVQMKRTSASRFSIAAAAVLLAMTTAMADQPATANDASASPNLPVVAPAQPVGLPAQRNSWDGYGWSAVPDDWTGLRRDERPIFWRSRPFRDWRIWTIPDTLFCHANPNDPKRHVGKGQPLVGTSWLNRPYHADWFVGRLFCSRVASNVSQNDEIFGGYRFGKDFDHYWGWEARLGFARPKLIDEHNLVVLGSSNLKFWDASLLYYPWGDARWRPYATMGMGISHVRFADASDHHYAEALLHVPVGIGVKYQCKRWLALRLDLLDNFTVGSSGVRPMHNVSLTGGVEVRFGGTRTSYFPWNPGVHIW